MYKCVKFSFCIVLTMSRSNVIAESAFELTESDGQGLF